MKVNIISLENKKTGDIELLDDVFSLIPCKDILHRVVVWQQAKRQAGTHKVKERNEVNGTGKKPFAQKGTGNARQGDKKAPHLRGGGNAHGPRVRSHSHSLNKKFRKLGLKNALSLKASEGNLIIVDDVNIKNTKTKDLSTKINKIGLNSALFIDGNEVNDNFLNAVSNLKNIDILPSQGANVYDILNHEKLVITKEGVTKLQERLA